MKHYGDITKINGGEVPAVDVVTFGAPCQDLSVAGLRHGMRHEALGDEETTRSGLFYEAVRIIKEMRDHDRSTGRAAELVRPRYAIYENVPGALSSNGGKDWQAVIQSLLQVVRKVPDIPVPERGWPSVGSFCGVGEDGVPFSLAYKQHDAQYWGVPQRRKRLSIVVDYAGFDAPWILFDPQFVRASETGEPHEAVRDSGAESESGEVRPECEGLPGDTEPSGAQGQGASAGAESGAGSTVYGIDHVITTGGNCTAQGPCIYEDVEATLKAAGPHAVAYGFDQGAARDVGALFLKECAKTITNGTAPGHHNGVLIDGMAGAISFQERAGKPGGGKGILIQHEHVGALSTLNNQSVLTYSIGSMNSEGMKSDNPQSGIGETDVARTIDANGGSPAGYQGGIAIVQSSPSVFSIGHDIRSAGLTSNEITDPMTASDYKDPIIIAKTYQDVTGALTPGAHPGSYNGQDAYNDMLVASSVVRRLTPMECERLQGYPDGWTDIGEWTDSKGKLHKEADSPRYKALGNSIALPFWAWLARRICAQYERPMTMASLFDGIGGFPLAFSAAGAIPVWASEIEEFPIAVTKLRFPEPDERGGES